MIIVCFRFEKLTVLSGIFSVTSVTTVERLHQADVELTSLVTVCFSAVSCVEYQPGLYVSRVINVLALFLGACVLGIGNCFIFKSRADCKTIT